MNFTSAARGLIVGVGDASRAPVREPLQDADRRRAVERLGARDDPAEQVEHAAGERRHAERRLRQLGLVSRSCAPISFVGWASGRSQSMDCGAWRAVRLARSVRRIARGTSFSAASRSSPTRCRDSSDWPGREQSRSSWPSTWRAVGRGRTDRRPAGQLRSAAWPNRSPYRCMALSLPRGRHASCGGARGPSVARVRASRRSRCLHVAGASALISASAWRSSVARADSFGDGPRVRRAPWRLRAP